MAISKKGKSNQRPSPTKQNFLIVGVGASAGGLDAFKRLLSAIPENSGMAYVLVQHLDPSHESILPEILQRSTKIPVLEIIDDIPLARNTIYIIPSNKMLISTDGILKLSEREKKINIAIDVFFKSLAEVHKELAIGIVLSGTGSDGTSGLKAIKEHGGVTIAQDSDSAAYDSMPQSAVNAGVVDFVLAPENIPEQLLIINKSYLTNSLFDSIEELPKDDEATFRQILLLLRQRSGVDFTHYKQPTFHRRIARRITITKNDNLADYLKFLRTDKSEQEALFFDVLIPVTAFFRDPKTFRALTENVFPSIIKNKNADEAVRIWIAGCSTGEEAFSVAICLHEYLTLLGVGSMKIQIFASDISEKAIKKARKAIYTISDIEKLSENQRNTYFVKSNGNYEVKKLIRDMCVFAPHNFLKDPPFAKMDLITCRNVLIYMETFLQKKAFSTFYYALKENGFLLLGKSETVGTSSDLFSQVNKNEKIYARKNLPGRFIHIATDRNEVSFKLKDQNSIKLEPMQTDFKKSAEAIMIAKSPASVVINEQMDIVHIHGDITPFLQAPQGKPTHNLIKMAREGLAFELRNGIHKASKEKIPVLKENIPVKTNEKQILITIEVIPLNDTIETHYLVLFEEKSLPSEEEENKSESIKINEKQNKNLQLEKELSQTREDMRYITEDMEAANEELQSANEELQSSNEEMQSLNEELETSKEELQSTNEELTIVNQELVDKQEQLNLSFLVQEVARKQIEASEKRFSNILSQSLMAVAILKGPEMIVTFANEQIIEIWGKGSDIIGKPMLEVLPEIKTQVFPKLLIDVYNTGIPFASSEIKSIINRNGSAEECYFNLIYQPLRDEDDSITGITVLSTEITAYVLAKKQIEESGKRFSNLISQAPALITTYIGPTFILDTINKTALEIWEKSYDDIINKPLTEISPEIEENLQDIFNTVYTTGETYIANEYMVNLKRDGKPDKAYFNSVYQPLKDSNDKIYGIISIGTEVTETVNARKMIEANALMIQNIYMNAPASICTFKGPKHTYELVNPAYQKLFDNRELVGKPILEALPELIGQGVDTILDHVYNTGEIFTSTEIPITIAKSNNEEPQQRYYNTTMQPIYDEDHKIIGVVNFGFDVTEQITARKKIEESANLAESARLLAEKAKIKAETTSESAKIAVIAKQQFLSNMSHEIRTPMNAIIGFTKVLMKSDLSEKQTEYLEAIKSSGNTLIVLINDILDLAKVDAGKMVFLSSPFNISDSINNIIHLFETKIHDGKIELILEFDQKIPRILLGDSVRLHQIIINLLSNAIKFTPSGKITVTVDLINDEKEKVTLEIKISDTGIGIPEDKIPTIFENFEQAYTITSNLYGGTGLGLAIVKQLVEKQGGTISVKSIVDQGSTFSFILSFQKTKQEVLTENVTAQYATKIYPLKVLIVEDVKLNQLLMKTILDDFKFDWDIAENGQIALEKLTDSTYDIILMDLQMPIMNGFEATKNIRNKMKLKTPIIAVTADVTTVDGKKCVAIGMDDYISKPVDEKLLYQKILNLVKIN